MKTSDNGNPDQDLSFNGPDDPDRACWAEAQRYQPAPKEVATHLIIGTGEVKRNILGQGIIAICGDEFTAHRLLKEMRRNPLAEVEIFPYSESLLLKIHQVLTLLLSEADSSEVGEAG